MPNQPPLNPDAHALRKAVEAVHNETCGAHGDLAHIAVNAYVYALAAAQPEVNSLEELDALPVGSVVRGGESDLVGEKVRHSPYPPHWCTIGEEVEAYERDLLPARVLYRPEVNDV